VRAFPLEFPTFECQSSAFLRQYSRRSAAVKNHEASSMAVTTADLSQLAKAGSDLKKPHDIDFFFHFPTQDGAEKAAPKLRPSMNGLLFLN
jgi:hypothetical protein